MNQNSSRAALDVALAANASAYRRSVQSGTAGDCWDLVILTAANEKQAEGYRQELALRERAVGPSGAFFPSAQRTLVVPDPPGRRAGSGGATLGAIAAATRALGLSEEDLRHHHILLIHSGGASQRLPAYSPLGKIFAPLPLLRPDGQIATLFDHLYVTLAGLPQRLGPGMLVLAGDVFLLFDHRSVAPPKAGVTAITMRVEAEQGSAHGVFVSDDAGRVTRTLQKASLEQMLQAKAVDAGGKVLIDTGLLFFDPGATLALNKLAGTKSGAGLHERFSGQIDLYEDITGALARATKEKAYLTDVALRPMRRELWKQLRPHAFWASEIAGEFLHLGTTRQFRDAMIGRNSSPAAELFQQNILAHSDGAVPAGRRVYHSVLQDSPGAKPVEIGDGAVVEHSIIAAGSSIGAGSVVSQVWAGGSAIDVPAETLLFQTPVRDADEKLLLVQVVCGVGDDFKGSYDAGKCVYFNRPIDEWLARWGVKPSELWPDDSAQTLWNARLFMGSTNRDGAANALALAEVASGSDAALFPLSRYSGGGLGRGPSPQKSLPSAPIEETPSLTLPRSTGGGKNKKTDALLIKQWRKSPRYSMAMILGQADPHALIAHREVVSAALQGAQLIDSIRAGKDLPIDAIIGRYMTTQAYAEAERVLEGAELNTASDCRAALRQARASWGAAQLLQRPDHPAAAAARPRVEHHMKVAFAMVAQAGEIGYRNDSIGPRDDVQLKPGLEIIAAAPVRLDLAGGWTDTPPYCFDRGGHVVNIAIDLEGKPPVRAIVRTTVEPKLVFESHDLGRKIELTELGEQPDVRDPFALHYAALSMVGLTPTGRSDLRKHLRSLGAGLHIATESRVPKGSGLGTSSILAAALIAALHRLRGKNASPTEIIEQTLIVEQRLSTGGGWQDQIGGAIGGIKSALAAPGLPQRPAVEKLKLSDELLSEFQDRLVVYYSGQQRLARDILRRVMGRWLAREPAMQSLTRDLAEGAAGLRSALLKGRWSQAATHIARYWQIKKELYPGSTTPAIDLLFLETRDDYLAAGLAGAGGGGFAYFLCRNARQATGLRERLVVYSARPGITGSVYETRINQGGLLVKAGAAR